MLSKAVQLNPGHLSALNYLGLCHMELDRFEEALGFFNTAIKIDPSYKYAHENRKIVTQTLNENKGLFGHLFGKR
jgi:lipoprotein NlpI